jgi:predicted transcriptional regulator
MSSVAFTIEIEPKLAERLKEAAQVAKLPVAELIGECVLQHLDVAARHRAIMERVEIVDQGLLELANFIGEATAGGDQVDLSKLCRYAPQKA